MKLRRVMSFVTAGWILLLGAVSAEELRPDRPPSETLSYSSGREKKELKEGRRILLDEDSYPRLPAKIVEGPTVSRKDGGYVIGFALDRPDDVLVRIVDEKGNTVRNLVCGVLGWNAPEPLRPNALAQELFWDGKDAEGKPAPPGCKIRIGVGLQPRFDRFVAHDPEQILPDLCALEVDAQGRVYLGLHTARRGDNHLVRYDRDGNYLEACFPPNLNLLKGKLEDVHRRVTYVDGQAVPSKRWLRWPHFAYKMKYGENLDAKFDSDPRHHPFPIRFAPDGRAYVVDAGPAMDDCKGAWAGPSEAAESLGIKRMVESDSASKVRLMNVQLDPFWFLDYFRTGYGPWTFGSDGNAYFVRGNDVRLPGIFKASWPDLKPAADFEFNGEDQLGEKRYFLSAVKDKVKPALFGFIADLTVDAEGNLYVADEPAPVRGAKEYVPFVELKIFRPKGRLALVVKEYELAGRQAALGSIYGLRGNGNSLYVVAREGPIVEKTSVKGWRSGKLVKFGISAGPTLKAIWDLPLSGEAALVAVDSAANPPIVWVGNGSGPATLMRIIDRGDAPGEVRRCGPGIRPGVLVEPWAIALDGRDGIFVYDYARGRIVRTNDDGSQWTESDPIPFHQTAFCCDRARDLLYVAQGARVARFRSDLKPDVLESGKPFRVAGSALGAVKRSGDVLVGGGRGRYIMATAQKPEEKNKAEEPFAGAVMVYDSLGNPKNNALCLTYAPPAGIAMDSRGAIYVSDMCVPRIEENMTVGWRRGGKPIPCDSEVIYVLKFPPEGGVRLSRNELWAHRGASPHTTGDCVCSVGTNCLAADDSDRIFATDLMKYHIKVLDTAGNLITRIGSCGNADCRGPESKYPKPEIAFWWVHSIDCRGDYLYASDRDLRRVVKVKMDYRESREVELPR